MPAPAKVLHVLGLLAKVEATYGTGVALSTATDGVLMQFADKAVGAPVALGYANDGVMGPSASSLVMSPRTGPTGRSLSGDIPMRFRGPGTTFTTAVFPSIHGFLQAAGFTPSLSTGAYTYAPTAAGTGYLSQSLAMYARGELWPAIGCLSNLQFAFPDAKPALFTFPTRGISSALPTDVTAPLITYPSLPSVPLGVGMLFTFGSFTAGTVYSGSFDLQRDLETARVALTQSGGHLGFVPGMRNAMLKVVVEQTAFVTATPWQSATAFNPYALREAALQNTLQLKFTDPNYTVGNSIALTSPKAQLVDAVPGNNGMVPTVELTFEFKESAEGANDDLRLIAA